MRALEGVAIANNGKNYEDRFENKFSKMYSERVRGILITRNCRSKRRTDFVVFIRVFRG